MNRTGDKVLLKKAWKTKFNQVSYVSPYTVTEVQNNGIVRARKGNATTPTIYTLSPLLRSKFDFSVCHR